MEKNGMGKILPGNSIPDTSRLLEAGTKSLR
jgi:hypothetical protein